MKLHGPLLGLVFVLVAISMVYIYVNWGSLTTTLHKHTTKICKNHPRLLEIVDSGVLQSFLAVYVVLYAVGKLVLWINLERH